MPTTSVSVTGVPSVNPCAVLVVITTGLAAVASVTVLLFPPTVELNTSSLLLFLVIVMFAPADNVISF